MFFLTTLYASLSLAKFDSIASTRVHLLPPPLSFPPSSLCHFIALSRPPFQTGGEKTRVSERRVTNQRELVGYNTGCVFVQDLVVL